MQADITVENHGPVYLFRPATAAGRDYLAGYYPASGAGDDYFYFSTALAVSHRDARDVASRMIDDGLSLE
jgi:hypothetical protein